jgi:hypothetical protein
MVAKAARFWLVGLALSAVGVAYAADGKALDDAKASYLQTLSEARKQLSAAFDPAIKQVAATGDLNAVKLLMAEKQAFEADQTPPESEAMQAAATAYQTARAAARDKLLAAYDAQIAELTKALKIDEASTLDAEKKAFQETGQLPGAAGAQPDSLPDDPRLTKLKKAKSDYTSKIKSAREALLGTIDKQIKRQSAVGHGDQVKLLEIYRDGFVNDGTLGSTRDVLVRGAAARYERDVRVARQQLDGAYNRTLAQLRLLRANDLIKWVDADRKQWLASTSAPGAAGGMVKLLSKVDLKRDADPPNKWALDGEKLRCTTGGLVPKLYIPYQPPQEYDIQFKFSQPKLRNGLGVILPKPNGQGAFVVLIGGRGGQAAMLGNDNNHPATVEVKNLIVAGKTYRAQVQVRKNSVRLMLNNKRIISHRTDYKDLTVGHWHRPKRAVGVVVFADDPATIEDLQLRPVTGHGKWTVR